MNPAITEVRKKMATKTTNELCKPSCHGCLGIIMHKILILTSSYDNIGVKERSNTCEEVKELEK